MSDVNGWREEKRAYGNAFAVYALAALYGQTHDPGFSVRAESFSLD